MDLIYLFKEVLMPLIIFIGMLIFLSILYIKN